MTRRKRNLIVWAGVATISVVLWYFTARVNLHFIKPMQFLIYVAIAAAAITALLWWEVVSSKGGDKENTSGARR